MKTFLNAARAVAAVVRHGLTEPAKARDLSKQLAVSPQTHLIQRPANQMPSWLASLVRTALFGQSSPVGKDEKALVVVKHVDALDPLKNMYGDDPPTFFSPIPNHDILKSDGAFKYCVTKHRQTGIVGVLVAKNTSAAHVGLLRLADRSECDVVMGGHIHLRKREDGISEVLSITNTSGHLQPEGKYEQQQVAELAFMKIGLDAQGKYMHKMWDARLNRYVGKPIDVPGAGTELKNKQ